MFTLFVYLFVRYIHCMNYFLPLLGLEISQWWRPDFDRQQSFGTLCDNMCFKFYKVKYVVDMI